MRYLAATLVTWAVLTLTLACTAPRADQLPGSDVEAQPELDYLHVAAAEPEPEPPVGHVGLNPGCPRMRVFEDANELCRHGIMPLGPDGHCYRMPKRDAHSLSVESDVRFEKTAVEALHGRAEIFVRRFETGSTHDRFFVALRGINGYVLLAELASYDSMATYEPELLRFVGTPSELVLETSQVWVEGPSSAEVEHRETTRCVLDERGGLRCNDECPALALSRPRPALDCAAIAAFDWSSLSSGTARDLDGWGGWDEELQADEAADYLGVELPDDYDQPARVRDVELDPVYLTMISPGGRRWAVMDSKVPLLASDREPRVGEGPGGVFVESWSNNERRLHRLDIDAHELEPVLPGACGRAGGLPIERADPSMRYRGARERR
jgi:hypothetical protein